MTRSHGRHKHTRDVEEGSLTIMPAAGSARWSTVGPIDFAHITLTQAFLGQLVLENFDIDPSLLQLQARLGVENPFVRSLLEALLADAAQPRSGRLYRESLIVILAHELVASYSMFECQTGSMDPLADRLRAKGGLATWQLRRVTELMRECFFNDLTLGDLIAVTDLRRLQLFLAFRCSTGRNPNAFLTDLRVEQAVKTLATTSRPLSDISASVGLDTAQLAHALRRRLGVSPIAHRRQQASVSGGQRASNGPPRGR